MNLMYILNKKTNQKVGFIHFSVKNTLKKYGFMPNIGFVATVIYFLTLRLARLRNIYAAL